MLTDPFQDYLHYLHDSHQLVETAYQLEKEGGFDGGNSASRGFIRHRLPPERRCCGTCGTPLGAERPRTEYVCCVKAGWCSNSTTPTPSRIR